MKKQRQNISSSIEDNSQGMDNLGTDYPINVNSASNTQNTPEFITNKRDRMGSQTEISGDFSVDLSVDQNVGFKRQKIEDNAAISANPNTNTLNNSNTINNANNNFNIINNSHTGNINVNINNFMGNLHGNSNIKSYYYVDFSGMNTTNYRHGMGAATMPTLTNPYVTPTYNLYQNLAGYNKVQGQSQFAYSSYYGGANLNMGNPMYNPRFGPGANVLQNYNSFSTMTNSIGTASNVGTSETNSSQTVEKKKYIIKELPEMTVGNYLMNKNMQDIYLKSIKKDEVEKEGGKKRNYLFNNNLETPESSTSNAVIESKTVQAQLNNSTTGMKTTSKFSATNPNSSGNIIYQPTGNVISFNNKTSINTNAPQVQGEFIISKVTYNNQGGVINQSNTNLNLNQKPNEMVSAPKSGDFSEALQKYIQRAYEKCKDDFDRGKCQKALMKIIPASLKKGDMNTRDWNNYPLPVLPSDMRDSLKPEKTIITEQELRNREKRKGRFEMSGGVVSSNSNSNVQAFSMDDLSNLNSNRKAILIGTCQSLEKQYLRLTTIPDPSQVRPEQVLKKSLQMLKEKWRKKEADYNYISEQFRSIRQDMTIQHIQNELTVKVYETHARVALESYDLDQFNQCQTALILLYKKGLPGSHIEFLAYRILYTILQGVRYEMEILLKEIYAEEKKSGIITKNYEISHALKFMKALNCHNYFECFKLYRIAPNMGSYLIEPFLSKLRIKALLVIAAGYITEANISALSDKFAFDSVDLFVKFLEENQVTLSKDKKKILCKESVPALNNSKHLILQFKTAIL